MLQEEHAVILEHSSGTREGPRRSGTEYYICKINELKEKSQSKFWGFFFLIQVVCYTY